MKNIDYLKSIERECETMAIEANIEIGIISNIKINSRAKSRWGLCRKLANGTFSIEISDQLLQDNVEKSALADTVMHEILHTVDGCMNHGKKWKECAETINKIYGMNIKRCTSAEEKRIEINNDYNYIIQCPKCGYQWKYIRFVKCVEHPERYKHGGCSNESLIRIL